jgi:ribosomal protein L7Ae-like RNA K-turn-binding protein
MDCESIECIPTPQQFILKTPVASVLTKEIFFDRFQKEILKPFRFTLSSQLQILEGESLEQVKQRRSLLQHRMVCGINAVTRMLEAAIYSKGPVPLLLVLTTDVYPSVTAHLPILAQQIRVPILLLPGVQSSAELGKLLGTKNVAALAFVSHHDVCKMNDDEGKVHAAVDSLANFVRGKLASK